MTSAHLLSNGRYATLLSAAGTGYSAFGGLILTPWSADRTGGSEGFFIFVRDLENRSLWSLGHQPVQRPAEWYEVLAHPGRVTITRLDDGIEARMDVAVASDDDIEIRRVSVCNRSNRCRHIELTSYVEVALGHPRAHAAHPAFSKLFVQTEHVPGVLGHREGHGGSRGGTLLAWRRPRRPEETPVWMAHAATGNGILEYETDRARFLGRGRSVAEPLALTVRSPLSGTAGNVLDPVLSVRRVVTLEAGASREVTFLLGAARSREAVLTVIGRHADDETVGRVLEHATLSEREQLAHLDIPAERAGYLQALAGAMLCGDARLRPAPAVTRRRTGRLADLLAYGLGPDALLVVAQPRRPEDAGVIRELVKAHAYWRTKGLRVDVLILHDRPAVLPEELRQLSGEGRDPGDGQGVMVRRRGDIPPAHLDLLLAFARLVVTGSLPALGRDVPPPEGVARFRPAATDGSPSTSGTAATLQAGTARDAASSEAEELRFENGYGGFSQNGCEYVIRSTPDGAAGLRRPPMPWVNVIANETFGFLASDAGTGCTWSRNSREHRLTPWHNDPIADPHGEALYVRDEDAGVFWSPTPGPVPQPVPYEVRHGFGYTRYRHVSQDLEQEVCLFVPRAGRVKVTRLRLTNRAVRTRHLSLFAYYRLVLGELPEETVPFIVTAFDRAAEAIVGWNRLDDDLADDIAFAAFAASTGTGALSFTGDRTAFIGRQGSLRRPAALMSASALDRRTGAGLDPCLALQLTVSISPGATLECAVLLGEAGSRTEARSLVEQYRSAGAIDAALDQVRGFWGETLAAVRVETPTPAIDLMVNGWLGYQNLSCRLWARSAFYQSGGAFGFRDQLQDAAALIYLRPDLTRAQILLHAGHQFIEGDVLHWWHPPASRGIRTRFSDDLLWLPYVTAFYVQATGDRRVLAEPVRFLAARTLEAGEDEAYLAPEDSGESADLYEHCCRALDRSLTQGDHGLPLMGTGDWNDGMNRVGRGGRGESVWLAFFIYFVLGEFIPLCAARGDHGRVVRYRTYQQHVRDALDVAGWDGSWYRRAYYDDGTPLGSANADECRIDAVAQAWAVISRAAPPDRAARAMDAVEQHLVSEQDALIRLLAPPFDRTPNDPGYIKGYVPGVRENGGQYTHAALWVVRALAELGRGDRAATLLSMLSPVSHTQTPAGVARYQVEPYVVAADVYGVGPHTGRGGWTWYTGSAGWLYRVAIESVLGLTLENGDTLVLKPCIPKTWPAYRLGYRLPDGQTRYEILVRNPPGGSASVVTASCDGMPLPVHHGAARIPLRRDGLVHDVCVTLG